MKRRAQTIEDLHPKAQNTGENPVSWRNTEEEERIIRDARIERENLLLRDARMECERLHAIDEARPVYETRAPFLKRELSQFEVIIYVAIGVSNEAEAQFPSYLRDNITGNDCIRVILIGDALNAKPAMRPGNQDMIGGIANVWKSANWPEEGRNPIVCTVLHRKNFDYDQDMRDLVTLYEYTLKKRAIMLVVDFSGLGIATSTWVGNGGCRNEYFSIMDYPGPGNDSLLSQAVQIRRSHNDSANPNPWYKFGGFGESKLDLCTNLIWALQSSEAPYAESIMDDLENALKGSYKSNADQIFLLESIGRNEITDQDFQNGWKLMIDPICVALECSVYVLDKAGAKEDFHRCEFNRDRAKELLASLANSAIKIPSVGSTAKKILKHVEGLCYDSLFLLKKKVKSLLKEEK